MNDRLLPLLSSALALIPAGLLAAQGADSCMAPQQLKGYGTFPFDSAGATTDGAADALCAYFNQQNIFNDVWFVFIAPETNVVDVTNCGASALDSKIAIYGGGDCASPVIACSDDNCSTQTKVTFGAQAGQPYLVRIGSYSSSATGSGNFTVSPFVPLADITDPVSGNRYVAYPATTWTSAEAFAQQLGGHLVSINSQSEQDFVWQNFGNLGGVDRRLWIGFTDASSEGAFAWSDGTVAKYTNWNPGEPNNSSGIEHYAELLGSNGRWNDLSDAGAGFAHIAVAEILGSGGGPQCPADLTGDLFVNAQDIAALLSGWGTAAGDVTGDGTTDAQDIAALLSAWGDCPL